MSADTKWARNLSGGELDKLSADKNIGKEVQKEMRRREKHGIAQRRAKRA